MLEQLAAAVAAQWNREAEIRGLNFPLPLSVGWSAASRAMMDRPSALAGGSARRDSQDRLARFSGQLSEVADAFERIPARRLVVIGDPGAGKTVLVVQLVRELLKRRIPGQPVPVLLPIASWNPNAEHLHAWMAARLEESYPALRARAVITGTTMAMQFIQTNRILPVLDGLDEMPSGLRAAAVRSLNRALPATDPLVLTCRADEYRQAIAPVDAPVDAPAHSPADQVAEPLAAAAVVELCPLRRDDVEAYLREATPHRYADKWIPVFRCLREDPHGPLAQALSTPLMTALARTAYCDSAEDPAVLLELRSRGREGIEGHLIDRLVPALYAGHPRPAGEGAWTAEQARAWMSVLALCLSRLGTPDLAWWRLYRSVSAPVFGLLFGLVSGIMVWLASGIPTAAREGAGGGVSQVAFGVMFGAAAALVVGTERRPPAAPAGRRAVASHLAGRLSAGLAGGLPGGIVYMILDSRYDSLLHAFVFGMANACTVGLTVGLTAGLSGGFWPSEVRLRLRIDTRSVARAMGTGLVVGAAMGIGSMVAGFGSPGILGGLAIGLMTGLVVVVRDALGPPADVTQAASPSSVWRADRMNAVVHAVISGLLGAATIGVVAALVTGPAAGFHLGFAFGAVYAIAAISFTAWYRFIVARIWFRLSGRLPWRLLTFLSDAHRRGLLRQVGAVHQFRHARLQDRLVQDRLAQMQLQELNP
jgi:hypothetical protein